MIITMEDKMEYKKHMKKKKMKYESALKSKETKSIADAMESIGKGTKGKGY